MAFVSVPKDLTKVKNKIIFNLTKRQLICFGIAAAVGVPFYFLTRGIIGSSNAATGMCLLMLPAFLFAMYEKDGLSMTQGQCIRSPWYVVFMYFVRINNYSNSYDTLENQ